MSPDEAIDSGLPLDDTYAAAPAEEIAPAELSFSALPSAEAGVLSATGSAIGSATAHSIDAVGSAVGISRVEGDFSARFSSTPLVYAKGDATIRQSYASALVAGETVEMSQALAPLVAGRVITIDMGGGAALVAGEARIQRGWIGVLLSGKTEMSDDTRVLIGTRAALIIGAALLGGFALVAIAGLLGVRRFVDDHPIDFEAMLERMPWYHA
jgi:hypothetical protein